MKGPHLFIKHIFRPQSYPIRGFGVEGPQSSWVTKDLDRTSDAAQPFTRIYGLGVQGKPER